MNVPERITVRLKCDSKCDLSNIIVQLTVTTGKKNPYHILFPKTDESGLATLTRDEFIGQFTDHWEAGLMDHGGTPETAHSLVRIELYNPSWALKHRSSSLAWPLLKHQRTRWASRDEEYRYRTSSRNLEFAALPITVDLHEAHNIVLPVTPRPDTTGHHCE